MLHAEDSRPVLSSWLGHEVLLKMSDILVVCGCFMPRNAQFPNKGYHDTHQYRYRHDFHHLCPFSTFPTIMQGFRKNTR